MIVRETIHHGDYRNVREQDIEPTFAGVVDLLMASPYSANSREWYEKNRFVRALAAELLSDAPYNASFGWALYEVLT
jgi:DNA modification methylase